jgi:ferredoxin
MVKLDQLADALAGLRSVQVQRRRCLAALSPRSGCRQCEEICPEGAVRCTPVPVIGACTGCGLCAAVCPGDALTLDDPSDHQLLQQAAAAARRSATVSVGCGPGAQVRVVCPGRVPPELLLAAVAAGADRVELVCPQQRCGTCQYSAGRELAVRSVQTVAAVLASLGRPEAVAVVDQPSRAPARDPDPRTVQAPVHQDRRDFLLAAFGLLRQSVPAYITGARPTPPLDHDAAARSPRRDLLLWACDTLHPAQAAAAAPWPGGRPALDGEPCTQCGVCVRLCPGRALGLGETGLTHLPRRCMHCGLCATVCPAGALVMAPDGALTDLLSESPAPLGHAATLTCVRCGDPFAATVSAAPAAPTCLPCHIRGSRGEEWLT